VYKYRLCEHIVQGWGTFLLSRAAWIGHYRWRAAKSSNFIFLS